MLEIMLMISAPISVLTTVPRPPFRLAPPITTAAMESSSYPSPTFGEPTLVLAPTTMAERP